MKENDSLYNILEENDPWGENEKIMEATPKDQLSRFNPKIFINALLLTFPSTSYSLYYPTFISSLSSLLLSSPKEVQMI